MTVLEMKALLAGRTPDDSEEEGLPKGKKTKNLVSVAIKMR